MFISHCQMNLKTLLWYSSNRLKVQSSHSTGMSSLSSSNVSPSNSTTNSIYFVLVAFNTLPFSHQLLSWLTSSKRWDIRLPKKSSTVRFTSFSIPLSQSLWLNITGLLTDFTLSNGATILLVMERLQEVGSLTRIHITWYTTKTWTVNQFEPLGIPRCFSA